MGFLTAYMGAWRQDTDTESELFDSDRLLNGIFKVQKSLPFVGMGRLIE